MMIGITGAGGFIGSHLAEALVAKGEQVLGIDLSDSVPTNLQELAGNPRFRYEKGDVRDASSISKALKSQVRVLYHLASVVGVNSYIDDPIGTIDSIVMGTRNVLDRCVESDTRLVFVSTSEIYGKNPAVPWKETSDRVLGDPSIDRWSYGTSKALCEHLVNAFCGRNHTPFTIARPFNAYGPRQRSSFVIPAVIRKILEGSPPIVYDNGEQTRCFTYVSDVVDGLVLCGKSDAASSQTFNLGNERETSINEAVKIALEVCGSSLKPVHLKTSEEFAGRYEDITRRVPDSSKAFRLLGWKPRVQLREGIEKTVNWAKSHPGALAGPPRRR